MADKALVLQLLDTYFSSLDLKSYSIHNKSGLTSFTLRFNGRDPDSQPDTGTFIRKSKYHVERDKARSDAHKLTTKRDRKQTQFYDAQTEKLRCDSETSLHSTPGMSPSYVATPSLSPDTPTFHMSATPPIPEKVQKEPSPVSNEQPVLFSSDCNITSQGNNFTSDNHDDSLSEVDSMAEIIDMALEKRACGDVNTSRETEETTTSYINKDDDSQSDHEDFTQHVPEWDGCDNCNKNIRAESEIFICSRGCQLQLCVNCASLEKSHPHSYHRVRLKNTVKQETCTLEPNLISVEDELD